MRLEIKRGSADENKVVADKKEVVADESKVVADEYLSI